MCTPARAPALHTGSPPWRHMQADQLFKIKSVLTHDTFGTSSVHLKFHPDNQSENRRDKVPHPLAVFILLTKLGTQGRRRFIVNQPLATSNRCNNTGDRRPKALLTWLKRSTWLASPPLVTQSLLGTWRMMSAMQMLVATAILRVATTRWWDGSCCAPTCVE